MPHTYSLPLKVKPEHIDALGHVNNVVYLQWVQDVAAAHWNSQAPPEVKEKVLWVVHRHELNYLKPAFAGDELTGQTWVVEMQGVKSIRRVNILRGEEILLNACTEWIMLDTKSMRPKRIADELAQIFMP